MGEGAADRERQIGGDGLLPFNGKVKFVRVVRICDIGESGKSHFVIDARIVDVERSREDPVADDGVGERRADAGEGGCGGECAGASQGSFVRHGKSSI